MDARRASVAIVERVDSHSPRTEPESPHLSDSPASNSSSPVTVPPPRHLSERTVPVPVPETGPRRQDSGDRLPIGSYNPTISLLGTSLTASPSSSSAGIMDGEFSEDGSAIGWVRSSEFSFASERFDLAAVNAPENSVENRFVATLNGNNIPALNERSEEAVKKVCLDPPSVTMPLKAKTTKAERRAMQEAQRAAKAASKANGITAVTESSRAANGKSRKQSSQKTDGPSVTASVATDKKSGDRPLEKERKKDVPPPRMQFDDKSRVEKAKRRAVVNQTEARNRVELFKHVPQYEHGTQIPELESKLFQLDSR